MPRYVLFAVAVAAVVTAQLIDRRTARLTEEERTIAQRLLGIEEADSGLITGSVRRQQR